MAIQLIASNPGASYLCRSGVITADGNGYISLPAAGPDLQDLIHAGCVVVPQAPFPASLLNQFGQGANSNPLGCFAEEGTIYRNVGNPIAGNAADTTDDIIGGIVLPANVFDTFGRGLNILAQGITGATTNNKRFKMFVNPTVSGATLNADQSVSGGKVTAGTPIADSGAWVNGTTPNNAAGWSIQANFFKYGAAGANTQYSQASCILGTLHGGISPPVFLTQPENAFMLIVVTGSSYTTGAANDIKLNFLDVTGLN